MYQQQKYENYLPKYEIYDHNDFDPLADYYFVEFKKRAEKRLNDVKRKAKPHIKNWTLKNYAQNFDKFWNFIDNCERIDKDDCPLFTFITRYEHPSRPVVLTSCQNGWKATRNWNLSKLTKDYRSQLFQCGITLDHEPISVKLKYFYQYMLMNTDDAPLCIIDQNFAETPMGKNLLKDYQTPLFFKDDLFRYIQKYRPPFRWFMIGSQRSGTGVRMDPLGTSSWHALVSGHKRWCLFPNNTPKKLLLVKPEDGGFLRFEAITWFDKVYPKTKMVFWPKNYRPIEIFQRPGEILFVPSGWWHVVLNLDNTVSITQNFCSKINFPVVWSQLNKHKPKLLVRLMKELSLLEPRLANFTKTFKDKNFDGFVSDHHYEYSESSSYWSSDDCSSSTGSDDEGRNKEEKRRKKECEKRKSDGENEKLKLQLKELKFHEPRKIIMMCRSTNTDIVAV